MSKPSSVGTTDIIKSSLKKRYAREARFKWYGRLAVLTGFVFLFVLLADIVSKGLPAFTQNFIEIELDLSAESLDVKEPADRDELFRADYLSVIKKGLRDTFPEAKGRKEKKMLYRLVSVSAEYDIRDRVVEDPSLLGQKKAFWLRAHSEANGYLKGQIDSTIDESNRRVKDRQIEWLDQLTKEGKVESRFNTLFFTAGDSREPEMAGIRAALMGSFWTLLVTFALTFPVGVGAAIYLEEFAPRNRLTDLIEININNLAAVPSIVFGLLAWQSLLTLSVCRVPHPWWAASCYR